jgi:hypothetical protein
MMDTCASRNTDTKQASWWLEFYFSARDQLLLRGCLCDPPSPLILLLLFVLPVRTRVLVSLVRSFPHFRRVFWLQ